MERIAMSKQLRLKERQKLMAQAIAELKAAGKQGARQAQAEARVARSTEAIDFILEMVRKTGSVSKAGVALGLGATYVYLIMDTSNSPSIKTLAKMKSLYEIEMKGWQNERNQNN
jgi:hypothetical protein